MRVKTMKIKYTGKARVRIEGIGYLDPSGEMTVPEEIGCELCQGEFREIAETAAEKEKAGTENAPAAKDEKKPVPRAKKSKE
jgi:hypothetical protein